MLISLIFIEFTRLYGKKNMFNKRKKETNKIILIRK
jgi:hypothetical protein